MAAADTAALVASLELKDKFSGPAAAAGRSLDGLSAKTSTLGRISGETQRGLGNLAHNLRTIGTIGVGFAVAGVTIAINAASDLNESLSKSNVVFAENAAAVEAWAATSATAFGQSKQQALEAAATYGNLFRAMGFTTDASTDMSEQLVELAADLASFNNTSIDDALLALRSGLTGETEPLKRFGVNLNEARLKAEALRLGLIKDTKQVLPAAIKAQAAYSLIMQDTALAQGDFARTSDGLANQQRILRAELTNVAATIGTALLPQITSLVGKITDLVSTHGPEIDTFAENLGEAFDSLIEIAGNLPWESIGNAFTLMGTGSKALLDAFNGLPPWVQTAVLTGWGLNKLTGGALTGIAGALVSGLVKGVLGINAGVVNINAATVTGGPGGGAPVVGTGGGGGGLLTLLKGLLGAAGIGVIAAEVTGNRTEVNPETQAQMIADALRRRESVTEATGGMTREAILQVLNNSQLQVGIKPEDIAALRALVGGTGAPNIPDRSRADRARDALQNLQLLQNLRTATLNNGHELAAISAQGLRQALAADEARRVAANALQTQAQSLMSLQTIASKDFSPTIKIGVTSNVTISDIQRKITSQQIAIGHGFQEFEQVGTHLYLQRSVSLGSSIIELSDVPDRQGTPFFEDGRSVIELGMRFNQAEASQGTFVFADPKGDPLSEVAYAFPLGHLLVTWTDDATGPELWIFRGRVANAEGGRAIPKVNHEVQWETTADDGNVDLRGQAFAESWARPEETDVARLVALQAYTLNGASSTATHHRDTCEITVNTSHLAPNSNTVTMPAKKYPAGTQPDEVVRDCADTAGKEYGVVIHHTGGSHLCLLYIVNDDNSTYASTIKISDQLADWDPEDLTAPVFEPHWERGSGTIFGMQTLLSGMVGIWGASEDGTFVEYGGGAVADAYDYWVEAYHDGISTTSGQAANRTAGILEGRRQTNVTHKASIIILPEQIPLIGAGMSIQVKGAAFSTADYITRRVAECRFEPRLDGRYWCHLDVTRPPLRVAPGRGRVGPIPPSQNEPPVASSDFLWTFDANEKDVTDTYPVGTLATNWHPGYVHTHVTSPGVGNRSAGSKPPITPGVFHIRSTISRSDGTPYNPGGVRLNVYSVDGGVDTLIGSSALVTSYSPTTETFDVTVPAGGDQITFEVPYNRAVIWEVEISHGSSTSGFVGTSAPPAATDSAGAVGTSPIYAPIDHQHPVQTAAVTPISDDAGYYDDSDGTVEGALAEVGAELATFGEPINIRDLLALVPFPICAHRGDIGNDGDSGTSYPENTLEAIRQAVKKGAHLVEFDLYLNDDDHWWVMHDSTVNRTTDGSGAISGKTDANMAALNIDGGYGYNATRHGTSLDVPTLDAILDVLRPYDVGVYFHLKETTDAAGTTLAEKIIEEGFDRRGIILCDGGASQAAAVKAVSEHIETAVLSGVLTNVEAQPDLDRLLAESAHPTSGSVVNGHFPKATDQYFEVSTHYGTDETSAIEDAFEFGVRILMTNYLDNALGVRAELVDHAVTSASLTDYVRKDTLTTKGDLYAATASASPARVGVGTDGKVLTADSGAASGVSWQTPSASAAIYLPLTAVDGGVPGLVWDDDNSLIPTEVV